MGYSYGGTFLVVFLTHPGVVIPTITSVAGLLPAEASEVIPAGGFPPVVSGLWQVLCSWALGAPGNGSAGLAWTMAIIYMIFIPLYLYFVGRIRLMKGI